MNLRENIKKELRLISEQPAGWWNNFFTANPQITPNDMVGYCADGSSNLYNPALQDPTYLSIINNLNAPYNTYPSTFWRRKTGCSLGTDGYPDSQDETCCYWQGQSLVNYTHSECSRCNGATLETDIFLSGLDDTSNPPPAGDPLHCPPGWQLTSLGNLPCQNTTTPCTHGNTSACASQWFQNPNASWAANWMNNRDCSNYTWPSTNLETQALSIMASAPNPQPNVYNDWNDIWSAGQNSGLSPANAFIAKMAKAKYSQCQKQACNC